MLRRRISLVLVETVLREALVQTTHLGIPRGLREDRRR
jgi:hypothetical protein